MIIPNGKLPKYTFIEQIIVSWFTKKKKEKQLQATTWQTFEE